MENNKNCFVHFLVEVRQQIHPFAVVYTYKTDTGGQTNSERAYQRIIEATLKYIQDNKL